MGLNYNAETGQWELENAGEVQLPEQTQIGNIKTDEMPLGLSPLEQVQWKQQATIDQGAVALKEQVKEGVDQKQEGFGSVGAFGRDILRGLGNAGAALGTDYVDLGLGLTDIAVQSASALTGGEFDGNEIFNDANNPLTQARQDIFNTETQAGKAVSDVLRVGVALLTLPKTAIAGAAKGIKLLTLGRGAGVANTLMKFDASLKAARGSQVVTKAADITAKAVKGKDATRAAKLIRDGDDLMRASFKELGRLGALGDEAKDAWRGTESIVSKLAGKKLSFRNFGEALAWDAFVAFNAAGEGDSVFDETLSDTFEQWGLPSLPFLQSDPLQSPLTAKAKQMVEGTLLASVLDPVLDMVQIARYARAFRNASPAEQKDLIRALDAEASVLGSGLGKNLLPAAKPSALDNAMEMGGPSTRMGWSALDNYAAQVDTARIQNQLTTETQSNLLTYQKGVVEQNRAAAVRGGSLSTESAGLPFKEVQVRDLGPTPDDTPRLNPSMEIEPVDVQVIRPPEPTVTPQTFRQAWTDYVRSINGLPDFEQLVKDGMVKLERLLPPGRVDGIDWMDAMEKGLNGSGVIQATDSLASNFYLHRGLLEGWASIDPETGFPQFNRKLAFDFDKSEAFQKQASKLDDAAELERYNQWLQGKEAENPGSMDPQVQARLGTMEGRTQGVPIDVDQATKLADAEANVADAGVTETLRQADVDDVKAQQFDAQEAAELDAAALEGIGNDSDSVLVAEMLGQRLDQLPSPTVEKLGARKYGLVDESGEVLEQFSTLKQAKKSLEAEQGRIREAAIARAKRMRDNATDQPQIWTPGGLVGESDVVGKIKFTKTQLKFLEDQGLRLPGTNYELSQTQMSEFAQGLRTLADSGRFVGQQKKMLNNMIDRLDVQVKTLEPLARAKRIVDDSVAKANKFIDNGEFCL